MYDTVHCTEVRPSARCVTAANIVCKKTYIFKLYGLSLQHINKFIVMVSNFFTCYLYMFHPMSILGTAVAQWLRCCATNRKVAGSIPDGVIGIFH